jgi:NADH:ubiquinone reductase (H+-translocating)
MDNIIPKTNQKRIVIIGGGFAGLQLAKKLKNENVQIVLLDKHNYHQFQPLFYQVATSGIEPSAVSFPIRKIFQKQDNLFFRVTEVLSIQSDYKQVDTAIGKIDYDYLVIATGAKNNFFGLKNVEQFSYPMKTTSESIILRNKLLQNIEDAVGNNDDEARKALLHTVVIGGGPTGVEISGALGEMKNLVIPRDFKELSKSEVKVTIVESGSKLLSAMSFKASLKTEVYLNELGVDILKNSQVIDYDGEILKFANGKEIKTRAVIWAAGVAGNTVAGLKEGITGRGNRFKVNEYNKVEGYEDIFAIGDISIMIADAKYPNGHPQVAPVAIQQAKCLSENLIEIINGTKTRKAFQYTPLGTMATVGRNLAVVEFNYFKYYGFLAWVTWLFVHLMSIVGIKNRLFIFLNWMWSYFTYDQSLRLIIRTCNCKPEQKKGTNENIS